MPKNPNFGNTWKSKIPQMAKHYSNSIGHVFLVRRQSYIPTYFSIHEFQLVQNKSDSEFLSETPASVEQHNTEYDYEDYSALPDQGTLESQLSHPTSECSSLSWLQNLAELQIQSSTPTTRLRSSGLARLFSCNVSKMSYETKSKLECDGYFGCPEERQLAKENGKHDKPYIKIPWQQFFLFFRINKGFCRYDFWKNDEELFCKNTQKVIEDQKLSKISRQRQDS